MIAVIHVVGYDTVPCSAVAASLGDMPRILVRYSSLSSMLALIIASPDHRHLLCSASNALAHAFKLLPTLLPHNVPLVLINSLDAQS